MSARKKYSKELELDAVSLVLEQGYGRSEATTSLTRGASKRCESINHRLRLPAPLLGRPYTTAATSCGSSLPTGG